MKKISYVLFILLVMVVGINVVNAKTCYKKTVKLIEYSTNYITGEATTNDSAKKNYCNNKTPCYKHSYYNPTITYSTSCKKSTKKTKNKLGMSIRETTCKEVSGDKCKGEAKDNEIWNEDYNFSSATGLAYVACGKGVNTSKCNGSGKGAYDIPAVIPSLTSFTVNALKIVTPVILVIVGMIQLVKALTSSSEDEIKKAQGKIVKKIVIAVFIFFIISITQFVVNLVADTEKGDDGATESGSVSSCLKCFLNGSCPLTYYRKGTNGEQCVKIKN